SESMISASTAELLAPGCNLDPETGYATALLRQLGLTLIAWNYPHIYARAFARVKEGVALDEAITVLLGFSPALLGISLAKKWNLTPQVQLALRNKKKAQLSTQNSNNQISAASDALRKICQTGEMLARAANPDHYPTAQHDWEEASQVIKHTLGAKGMELVREKIAKNCTHYASTQTKLFTNISNLQDQYKARIHRKQLPEEKNRYLLKCPLPIKQKLRALYEQLQTDTISKDNILTLVKEIIPAAGFQSGCVYSYEPTLEKLVPLLTIGSTSLSRFEAVECSPLSNDQRIIRKAFGSDAPVVEKQVWSPGHCASIAAPFGFIQRAGVLYLETSPQLANSLNYSALNIFNAMNQALMDCLKIS
ncbi:HDOD domain-containing protein, partial [Oligoflexia bacterium]|nr:HDOD domain-containing protein [Oligoflexia bacterium]